MLKNICNSEANESAVVQTHLSMEGNWLRASLSNVVGSVLGILMSVMTFIPAAYADDTEVFFGRVDQSQQIRPNVLFALDTSGSMAWGDAGSVDSRITRLKAALTGIMEGATNLNIGLMRFNGGYGGGPILYPLKNVDEQICEDSACGSVPLFNRLGAEADDAEEALSTGAVNLAGSILDIGEKSGTSRLVAMRFTGVDVPSGATLNSATLHLTAINTNAGPAAWTIGVENVDTAGVLANNNSSLSTKPLAPITQTWSPSDWNEDQEYKSPDIASVVQQIISRPGWCGGNDLTLLIEGTGTREAYSAESDPNSAPALALTYDAATIPPTQGCVKKTVVAKVKQKNDDAAQSLWYQYTAINNNNLKLPRNGRDPQLIGVRFQDLQIPQGATIESASIEFEIDKRRTGNVRIAIWGEANDNPEPYRSRYYNISNRAKTSASTSWINPTVGAVNSKITTPDLTNIAQQLVNRRGWKSGNAMAFMLSRRSGNGLRQVESYDGEPSNAPTLTITYTASGAPNIITVRDKLKEEVNNLEVLGGTPILDVMYEASLYYRGEPVDYGTSRGKIYGGWDLRDEDHRVSHPGSYTGGSVYRPRNCTPSDYGHNDCYAEEIRSGSAGTPVYTTPMTSSCQTNHIVVLSDGVPNSQSSVNRVKRMIGTSSCSEGGDYQCITDLAEWLAKTDHNPGLSGEQNITTYTIGFGQPSQLRFLETISDAGHGRHFEATTADQLQLAFKSILADVLDVETSFVAPGATVNQFNRLTHRNDIYFSLFKPGESPTWDGNLKKYQLANLGNDVIRIVDSTGTPAVDNTSGFFSSTSKSFWSDEVDGNEVFRGGVAGEIELTSSSSGARKVYTYTSVNQPDNAELNVAANQLSETNTAITKTMLGITAENNSYRTDLLKWARGVDVKDEDSDDSYIDVRKHIGDPMHSRPLLINYNAGPSTLDSTIFIATNEGFLHAVRHDTGKEIFSFIPQELLANLNDFYVNNSTTRHPYGLDGAMSTWIDDANNNTIVDSGEHAYVYLGMRRGGNNYYALDVTDRNNPKLKWIIKGGTGGTAGFEELGQSWSKPVFTTIKYGSEMQKPVLIFGAGYDVNQDDNPTQDTQPRRHDGAGRGIFIVDAKTGAKLWSGSSESSTGNHTIFSDMDYSIPSDIRVIDIDFDGNADQFYVGDMGGQLWRFDFNQRDSSGALVAGGVIADLAGSQAKDTRRFYYEPDVSLISQEGKRYLSIAIGSGWRAHPLDSTVKDRFYMIRSEDVYAKPAGYGKASGSGSSTSYSPITESDLLDVTNDTNPLMSDVLAKEGWMLRMEDSGEKVLGDSITVNNQLVFTSYKPDLDVGICDAAAGGGSVYTVDMFDGSPSMDLDESSSGTSNSDDLDKEDRSKDLKHGGIPPEPAALITEDGIPVVLVGPEQPLDSFNFGDLTERTWWQEESVE